MGKYTQLGEYLKAHKAAEIRLSFEQIERIIGSKLPPSSKEHRAWWSNNPSNSVMTKVWLSAGYRSEQVDIEAGKLVFRRVSKPAPQSSVSDAPDMSKRAAVSKRHPLFGAMRGLVRIAPGTDLTKPADPDWGERSWGDKS
jgi:hypothetical protein